MLHGGAISQNHTNILHGSSNKGDVRITASSVPMSQGIFSAGKIASLNQPLKMTAHPLATPFCPSALRPVFAHDDLYLLTFIREKRV